MTTFAERPTKVIKRSEIREEIRDGDFSAFKIAPGLTAGGLDRPYPVGNSDLLSRVSDLGVLVSGLPPGAAPTKWRFLTA